MPTPTSLQAERLAQLRRMADTEIDAIMRTIREATTVAKEHDHFELHGHEFEARDVEEYRARLRAHLQRADLRIFTYLRGRRREPFWELVAPNTGETVLYNEARGRLWTFYRIGRPGVRMRDQESEWVEVLPGPVGWVFEGGWRWST